MELRHLRYFVAVAAEQHMRKAAEKLRIAQPAITRQIADLEAELGYPLFDRLPRGLRLNAAGNALLGHARKILADVDAAMKHAQRAARGETGILRLGFIESAAWQGSFPIAIQAFRSSFPEVEVQLNPMYSRLQLQAIVDRELDGGFAYAFEEIPEACSHLHLRMDKVKLAAPRRYGWRKRKKLCLADFKDERFVWLERGNAPRYLDALMHAVVAGGLSPHIVQYAPDDTTLLSLVSAGVGLGFVNSAHEARKPLAVDFIPVKDLSLPLPLHFVWLTQEPSPALRELLRIIRKSKSTK